MSTVNTPYGKNSNSFAQYTPFNIGTNPYQSPAAYTPSATNLPNYRSPINPNQSAVPNNFNYSQAIESMPGAETGGGWGDWFGKDGKGTGIAAGIDALSGAANAYIGYKSLDLGKDQFGFAQKRYLEETAAKKEVYNNNIRLQGENTLVAQGHDRNSADFQTKSDAHYAKNSLST